MKRSIFVFSLTLIGMLFIASYANASIIVVDGDLSDWGVTPGAYGASSWVPNNEAIYTVEDQNTDYLNPGYGGQKFDAEAIYGFSKDGYIYGAIVTGFPANGYSAGGIDYSAGDIFFNLGAGAQYGLKTTGANIGMLYKNPLWDGSPYWGGITDPTTMKDGTGQGIGMTEFVYVHTYVGEGDSNDHWVMEMKIPESYFGSDWGKDGIVHWTESCGNDAIDLTIQPSGSPRTPEPATMSLLGLGLAGLLRFRKKKGACR